MTIQFHISMITKLIEVLLSNKWNSYALFIFRHIFAICFENAKYKLKLHTRSQSYLILFIEVGDELSLQSLQSVRCQTYLFTWKITRPKCRVLLFITVVLVLVKMRICYRNLWEKLDGWTGYNKTYETGVIIYSILNNSSKNYSLFKDLQEFETTNLFNTLKLIS